MKNVYMTVLLCATGLVATNGSFAATATEQQWSQSVSSYPARRTDGFSFKLHPDSMDCDPLPEGRLGWHNDTGFIEELEIKYDILWFSSDDAEIERFFACNWWDWGHEKPFSDDDVNSCPKGKEVAIAGTGKTRNCTGYGCNNDIDPADNNIWLCDADSAVGGHDEWEHDRSIPDCYNDDFQWFKYKDHVVPYLWDNSISGTTLYRAIVNPSDHVCITYACAPGYLPNMDVTQARINNSNSSQLKCVGTASACPLYSGREVSGHEYPNISKKAKCDDGAYFDINGADINNTNATHGTLYINKLREHMNAELADNITVARNLYNKRPDKENSSYTCDDTGCKLKEDILTAGEIDCDYLCTDYGFAVKLHQSSANDPCPMYFKQQYDTTKQIYVCNFDAEAVGGKIKQMDNDAADAAKTQRAKCAKLFCEESRGVYNNGNCTCEDIQCNDNYSYGGHDFTYCYKRFMGGEARCEKNPNSNENFWSTSNMHDLDKDREGWISALETCMSDAPASSGASSINATTDTISKLAGRLAKVEDQFGLSKWRTAEGKFNTARLASDLTAGVVLGTTGALVTSSVVKKKQVKDGFESLECTVGGQHVGDWGDVFRIDGK